MKSYLKKRVDEYLFFLENLRKYSKLTIKTYRLNLYEALEYVEIYKEEEKIIIDLIPFRVKISDLKKRTVYKKITIFRSFVNYLKENNENISLRNDELIKISKTLPKPISERYVLEALDSCELKERLLISLFFSMGVRIGEIKALKIKDINKNWVSVKGKGGKIRQIPILDELRTILDDYLLEFNPKEYLFEKNNKGMSENQIRYMLEKVFKRVGIKVTPHQLRHSFASSLLNNGARINDVSELLGHSSLSTTQIYTKLSASSKMRNYKDTHPLCRSDNESA